MTNSSRDGENIRRCRRSVGLIWLLSISRGQRQLVASKRQTPLPKSFHAAFEILGVPKRLDAAAALDREAGIYPERLSPDSSTVLQSAKVAVARRKQGISGLRLSISCEPLLDHGDRLFVLAQGEVRLGDELQRDIWIMRVQPH